MNCACIYNKGLVDEEIEALLPVTWKLSLQLDIEDVWNGFFLYALILEQQETGVMLELSHPGESQAKQLQPALHVWNVKMASPGQEAWNYACDQCCYIYQDEADGNFCLWYSLL